MQRAEGKFGVVTFMALGYGLVWGGLWMILSSMLLMLVSGLVLSPPVGMAAAAGAISGIVLVFTDAKTRSRQVAFTVAGVGVLSMLILTMAQPFGVPVENGFLIQLVTLLVWTGLTTASLFLCFDGYVAGTAKRYLVEVLIIRLMKGLALVLFTVFVALPFYVMVMTSLKSQQKLLANPLDFSIDLGQGFAPLFRSYIELFTQFHFGTFLMNSAIVSVITVMLTLAFAVPGAYAVARLRFPGQAFLSRSILLIYMVPAIVLVVPLYAVFSQLGLRNSLFGLLVVYPATTIPVALYMLQGYFRGLPSELEEAGLMDGLNRVQVIMKITLPLALPALASVSLYVFMIAWNEFLFAFMFLDNLDMFTLSRGVVSLNSSEVPRQHLMAGAVVATVPVLAVFLWFEKYLVSGLTAGSVKG
jgi:multiple sugar transport system permease protein